MDIDFRIYLITDRKMFADSGSFFAGIEEALKGGVRAVQLREKDLGTRDLLTMAYRMRELTKRNEARLFINDRVDIAMAVGADGVHLGRTGIPAYAARQAAGESLLIGVSAHSVEEAKKAEGEGADFITIGPVYETPSKMKYGVPVGIDVLKEVAKQVRMPVFAIGGIRIERAGEVLQGGASGIALISAILASKDIRKITEEFVRCIS
ncbi:MAG: thiamine phosphate synthase [Nitrospirae bacterium]|nr:thiamine phosphate synthase [Nitrospirota bacterium]